MKRPSVVDLATKRKLALLDDFVNLPVTTGRESCLDEDPDLFFSEFPVDIAEAKDVCGSCPLINSCLEYAMKHENYGVWGGLSAEERYVARGNMHAFDQADIDDLIKEKNFILFATAAEVADHYEVETRTVIRWRNTIRQAQLAS